MQEYLLELYISRTDTRVVAAWGESARAAAIELTRRGTPVRYRRSILLPDEETSFVLFEAESADAVRAAAQLAALPCERICAAVTES
jgi:hypothetical protein